MRKLTQYVTTLMISTLCATGQARAEDVPADVGPAAKLFEAAFRSRCADHAFDGRQATPTRWELTYRLTTASQGDPDQHAILYEFFCDNFAHSGSAVFILRDNDASYRILTFAEPTSAFKTDADGNFNPVGIDGIAAWDSLLNADFDPESKTMTTSDHVGNLEYYSSWKFVDGMFVFSENQTYIIDNGKLVMRPPEPSEE